MKELTEEILLSDLSNQDIVRLLKYLWVEDDYIPRDNSFSIRTQEEAIGFKNRIAEFKISK